jgi:hypothetical protein
MRIQEQDRGLNHCGKEHGTENGITVSGANPAQPGTQRHDFRCMVDVEMRICFLHSD